MRSVCSKFINQNREKKKKKKNRNPYSYRIDQLLDFEAESVYRPVDGWFRTDIMVLSLALGEGGRWLVDDRTRAARFST